MQKLKKVIYSALACTLLLNLNIPANSTEKEVKVFSLFKNSIYGYFIPIKTVQTLKANFYTLRCIIFYISYELFNPSVIKH